MMDLKAKLETLLERLIKDRDKPIANLKLFNAWGDTKAATETRYHASSQRGSQRKIPLLFVLPTEG